MSSEDEYINKAKQAAEDGTGSVREHAFLSAEELSVLRGIDYALDSISIADELLSDKFHVLVVKLAAQVTDPLPVMEDAYETLACMATPRTTDEWDLETDGEVLDRLRETIAAIKRERGQTKAAEHVDKLKEARDEHEPTP